MTGTITFRSMGELAEFVASLSEHQCLDPFEATFEGARWTLHFYDKGAK